MLIRIRYFWKKVCIKINSIQDIFKWKFLNESLYIINAILRDRIDVSEVIDVNKTIASKECDICH